MWPLEMQGKCVVLFVFPLVFLAFLLRFAPMTNPAATRARKAQPKVGESSYDAARRKFRECFLRKQKEAEQEKARLEKYDNEQKEKKQKEKEQEEKEQKENQQKEKAQEEKEQK
eukprot:GHVT01043847.1.p2 GENE.GHVT01043847.1~~GHVT01043847.1.p2  ORF type:complete len:114 (+),score=36.40 GHVT01043847.1:759-1100(+)